MNVHLVLAMCIPLNFVFTRKRSLLCDHLKYLLNKTTLIFYYSFGTLGFCVQKQSFKNNRSTINPTQKCAQKSIQVTSNSKNLELINFYKSFSCSFTSLIHSGVQFLRSNQSYSKSVHSSGSNGAYKNRELFAPKTQLLSKQKQS